MIQTIETALGGELSSEIKYAYEVGAKVLSDAMI